MEASKKPGPEVRMLLSKRHRSAFQKKGFTLDMGRHVMLVWTQPVDGREKLAVHLRFDGHISISFP